MHRSGHHQRFMIAVDVDIRKRGVQLASERIDIAGVGNYVDVVTLRTLIGLPDHHRRVAHAFGVDHDFTRAHDNGIGNFGFRHGYTLYVVVETEEVALAQHESDDLRGRLRL